MDIATRIKAFSHLGNELNSISSEEINSLGSTTANQNPWFTKDEIKFAIKGIAQHLTAKNISQWIAPYEFNSYGKKIALIAAGNIPLVSFHDFMAVLISGHNVLVKQSSKDSILLPFIAQKLFTIDPNFKNRIEFSEERIAGFDAVIATGSDNTARYFDYYFSKYPHIIRKNRTSCAILNGFETEAELKELWYDAFRYFGLGCRNVSKLFIPIGFDITNVLDAWGDHNTIIHHYKYANNYDYQKSIMLLNKTPFLDNGYALVKEDDKLVSPIAVLHYEYYADDQVLSEKINSVKDKVQCIVGNHPLATVPFGKAQSPKLDDYADQIDTLKFLSTL